MAKKINLKSGIGGRLTGAVAGGAASAVFDTYVTPMLPASISAYPDYLKIGVGVALPMLVKGNQLVNSMSDGLLTVGIANLVGSFLPTTTTTPASSGVGNASRRMIGAAPFPKFVENAIVDREKVATAADQIVG